MSRIKILIDTTPLDSGHAVRGIGTYTRLLTAQIEQNPEIEVTRSSVLTKESQFKPNIIHYPFFDLFFPTLPVNVRTKTVVTIHDVIPLKFPEFYKPGIRGSLNFKRQKLSLKTVNAVITDSESSKNDIIEHLSVPPDKIHVVALAANPALTAQDERAIRRVRRKYRLPSQYVLYVGDINYNKNIPQLIKMTKFLPDSVKLVCVGKNFTPQSIPEWQWIETQLALSDVTKRVRFVTDVLIDDVDDLSAIYTGALCYIQPSLYEGFGLPILEAMQCKTPVVCTQNSSLVEVGGDHVVFTTTEAESLATGVQTVLDWPKTKRQTVIKDAFKWAQTFSWHRVGVETVAIYRSLLGK